MRMRRVSGRRRSEGAPRRCIRQRALGSNKYAVAVLQNILACMTFSVGSLSSNETCMPPRFLSVGFGVVSTEFAWFLHQAQLLRIPLHKGSSPVWSCSIADSPSHAYQDRLAR